MATFTVDFLGCKVSHTDAHAVRERLLADGHAEARNAEIAVLNTCCVTNEAVAKSRKQAARLARTHRRVYVTGCGACAVFVTVRPQGQARRCRSATQPSRRLRSTRR